MTGRPRLVPGVVRGELTDGEVVISVNGGERALILNAVADVVVELCDGTRTVAQIAALLRDTLQVPPDADVARDVTAVLEELSRAGLVESVE